MNRRGLIRKTCELLRMQECKKPVSIPKHVFHISDDEGNSKDFSVKRRDKDVIYTVNDVENIIDACIFAIEDCIRHGESISIKGFGSLSVEYRKPRVTKEIETGLPILIEGHYVPRFRSGSKLKNDARVYEASLGEEFTEEIPEPVYDEVDEAEEIFDEEISGEIDGI